MTFRLPHMIMSLHSLSQCGMAIPQADRVRLWTELVDLVTRHRKFSDAKWAMKPEEVDKIAGVAEKMAPDAPISPPTTFQ